LIIYNGVSVMFQQDFSTPDCILSCDSTLVGCGGLCDDLYFHKIFPKFTNSRPGRTHVLTKCNFPSKDCNSFKVHLLLINQSSTKDDISSSLSLVIERVQLTVSIFVISVMVCRLLTILMTLRVVMLQIKRLRNMTL
jgi:hypothetical protein